MDIILDINVCLRCVCDVCMCPDLAHVSRASDEINRTCDFRSNVHTVSSRSGCVLVCVMDRCRV